MTATNTTKPAKDGNVATFTLAMASESVSTAISQKGYLASPSTELLIEPMPATGGSVALVAGSARIGTVGPTLYTPLGYQQITSLSSVQLLAVPGTATIALISVEGAGVRYRDDGTNPTASVGMPIGAGTGSLLYSGSLSTIAFIQQSAGAILNVSYYK